MCPATARKGAVDFRHRNDGMLGDIAHCRCFGKLSQRAVFDTKPIGKKDVTCSWTETLEELDGSENEESL